MTRGVLRLLPESHCEPFVVPQTLNVRHGVVVVENLRLEAAAREHVHEFLLVISHAKLRGATGAGSHRWRLSEPG